MSVPGGSPTGLNNVSRMCVFIGFMALTLHAATRTLCRARARATPHTAPRTVAPRAAVAPRLMHPDDHPTGARGTEWGCKCDQSTAGSMGYLAAQLQGAAACPCGTQGSSALHGAPGAAADRRAAAQHQPGKHNIQHRALRAPLPAPATRRIAATTTARKIAAAAAAAIAAARRTLPLRAPLVIAGSAHA